MIWAVNNELFDKILSRRKWFVFGGVLLLFMMSFIGTIVLLQIRVELKILTAIIFSALVTSAMYLLPCMCYNNFLTRTLGKFSLEIYVCQGFFLILRSEGKIYISNVALFVVVVLVGTAILSFSMRPLYLFISNKVKSHFQYS